MKRRANYLDHYRRRHRLKAAIDFIDRENERYMSLLERMRNVSPALFIEVEPTKSKGWFWSLFTTV